MLDKTVDDSRLVESKYIKNNEMYNDSANILSPAEIGKNDIYAENNIMNSIDSRNRADVNDIRLTIPEGKVFE